MPEMRPVTIRFGESLWSLIEDEANQDHCSAAHWIREACLARAMWERGRRGAEDGIEVLQAVRDQYRIEDEAFQRIVQLVLRDSRDELGAIISKLPPELQEVVQRWYGI